MTTLARMALVSALAAVLLGGCSEHVRITTRPSGATVYLEGKKAGQTPLNIKLKRSEIRQIPYRIELEGYRPVEGILPVRVAPGRAVAAAFTIGIVYLFKSPVYVRSADHDLSWDPSAAPQSRKPVEERLQQLQQLHRDGVLNQAEYETQRLRILEESK